MKRNQSAVVLGASKGIGAAVASMLLDKGINVVAVSRSERHLRDFASKQRKKKGELHLFTADTAKKDAARKIYAFTINKFNRVDILFLNSGGPPAGSFLDVTDQELENATQQLFLGQVRLLRLFAKGMIAENYGRIVNLGSSVMLEPSAGMVLSASVRSAFATYCKAASISLAKFGVTLNTISTGGVETKRLTDLFSQIAVQEDKKIEQVISNASASIPIGRFATPEEFVSLILFLFSEEASYITGQTIGIDGGLQKSTY